MTGVDTAKSAVANICKPGGGSKGNIVSTMSEQKLQVFAYAVRYIYDTQQNIDFKDWDKDFLKQYTEYMDLVKDALHDLTKIDIPVLGSNVIDGPKLFRFLDDTLGTARAPSGAHYSYVT